MEAEGYGDPTYEADVYKAARDRILQVLAEAGVVDTAAK